MSDLETRIAKLEAESDIRKLKARYLNACDAKNEEAIRACFTQDAEIEFPPLGSFDLREKTFRMLASFYEDRYRKTDKGWRISYTKSTPRTIVDGTLAKETLTAKWMMDS